VRGGQRGEEIKEKKKPLRGKVPLCLACGAAGEKGKSNGATTKNEEDKKGKEENH